MSKQAVGLIGGAITLFILAAGIVAIFWNGYREFGSFPAFNTTTAILYGGLGFALAACVAYLIWAWRSWRLQNPG